MTSKNTEWKTNDSGQSETLSVNRQALIDAVLNWEQKYAIQSLMLEQGLKHLEEAIRQCRNAFDGYDVLQAKGALLALFLSDDEWDDYLRQALIEDEETEVR